MKQFSAGMVQASALHPSGEAETGRRAGEIHKKPWHASTPPARSTARRAALPGAGGRQRPHPGRASSKEVELYTRYDSALPEDQKFSKATPNGEMKFMLQNPALDGFFQPGKTYLIIIEKAED